MRIDTSLRDVDGLKVQADPNIIRCQVRRAVAAARLSGLRLHHMVCRYEGGEVAVVEFVSLNGERATGSHPLGAFDSAAALAAQEAAEWVLPWQTPLWEA